MRSIIRNTSLWTIW